MMLEWVQVLFFAAPCLFGGSDNLYLDFYLA